MCLSILTAADNIVSRLLSGLVLIAAVMTTINLIQAFLIDQLHSQIWIVAFPTIVFSVFSAGLLTYTLLHRKALWQTWRSPKGL
jgi:hypothetical protein